jgi:NAD(P) transhydrogenase beta subunit
VVVLKRSMNPGFSGIENKLFVNAKTSLLFGDAKRSLTDLLAEVEKSSGVPPQRRARGLDHVLVDINSGGRRCRRWPDVSVPSACSTMQTSLSTVCCLLGRHCWLAAQGGLKVPSPDGVGN